MARQYSRAQYRLLSAKSRRRRTVDAISLEPVVAVGNDLRVAAARRSQAGGIARDERVRQSRRGQRSTGGIGQHTVRAVVRRCRGIQIQLRRGAAGGYDDEARVL